MMKHVSYHISISIGDVIMYILTIILVLLILITVTFLVMTLVLLTLVPIKVFFRFDLEEYSKFHLSIHWMNPIFKCVIAKNEDTTYVNVYLFNIKIINKSTEKNYNGFINTFKFLKALNPTFLKLDASYGFIDPSITGVIFGVIELVAESSKVVELNNNANFNPDYDYGKVTSTALFNAIPTIMKVLHFRKQNSNYPVLQRAK